MIRSDTEFVWSSYTIYRRKNNENTIAQRPTYIGAQWFRGGSLSDPSSSTVTVRMSQMSNSDGSSN